MMNSSGGMGSTAWAFMAVLWVLLIAAVVWAIAELVSRHNGSSGVTNAVRAEGILDRRLASGEIDVETYDALRAKLCAAASKL
jgi:putative membrane protein